MAQVVWTDQALADIDNIVAYVFNQSRPLAAQRLGQRLLAAGESLAEHPERGRTSTRGRREIVAVPPYSLRYRVVGDRVVIGSVRHSARRPI